MCTKFDNSFSKMDDDELLEEIVNLQAVKEMKVTLKSSIKYGTFVGVATIVCGILGGPVGLTVGGILSSGIAGYASRGEFESVPYILLHKTTPEEKQKLLKVIRHYLEKHGVTIVKTVYSVSSKDALMQGILEILGMFLAELGLQVVKH